MSRWLNALAKAGLVELEGAEAAAAGGGDDPSAQDLDALLAESRSLIDAVDGSPPAAAPPPQVIEPVQGLVDVQEGVPFAELFTSAGVAPSPLPAEKLLKILDGLKAMDPATRKAAVMAMDAAEDAWTAGDALLDAQRKMDALRKATARLEASASAAGTQAEQELTAQDQYKTKATEEIRRQIADLESMLEAELQAVADEKAAINARLAETRAACGRETARYEAEIDRLGTLFLTFPAES